MKTHAFPIQLAKEAILLEKYTDAIALIKPLSESQSNADAQFLHAYLHFWDDDLTRQTAIQKLKDLAEADHPEANYILAVCPDLIPSYDFVLPQTEQQRNYLQRSADLGSAAGITDLAQCYLEGIGVEQDRDKARTLLESVHEGELIHRNFYAKNCYLLGKMRAEEVDKDEFKQKYITLVRSHSTKGDKFAIKSHKYLIESIKEVYADGANFDVDNTIKDFETNLAELREKTIPFWLAYLRHYCTSTLIYDIRNATFVEYADFIFDHYPYSRLKFDHNAFRWYTKAQIIFDPQKLLHFYTELFNSPTLLTERFSAWQLEQGLGMDDIRGWGDWTLGCVMAHPDSTVEDMEACILAMYNLFDLLFAESNLSDTGFMWWDIGYGACSESGLASANVKSKLTDADRQRLHNARHQTQVRLLNHKSMSCQNAAIHGLQHSGHPERENALRKYLADNPDLPVRLKEFALHAIKVPM